MSWDTSDRRARLPKDWPKRVAATKARAGGRCEGISLQGEPRWHDPKCNGVGRECDHERRGDDHSLPNLRWLSSPCHTTKTHLEKPSRNRPAPQHPGVIR
jgi:5-methylcytosine-specific restriction protein A